MKYMSRCLICSFLNRLPFGLMRRYPLIMPYPRYSVTYTAQSPCDAASASAGQLTTPTSRTSAPEDIRPETRASFIMELLLMRSLPTTTLE